MFKYELSDELYKVLLSKGIILTGENIKSVIEGYKKKFRYLYSGAILHLVIPTLQCNQKCLYCHSNAILPSLKEKKLDKSTADRILNFIFQSPSNYIQIEFQGGESLLNFDMVKYIVNKAFFLNKEKKKELKFEIVTNLTLLNDDIIEFLSQNKIGICTSLDGPKNIHDMNRKFIDGRGTYQNVTKMIAKLRRKNINVGLLMVTTRHSLPYWKEIVDEYVKFGQHTIRLKFLDFLGFAQPEWDQIGYTVEEFLDFWKKAVDYIFSLNKKGILMIESNVDLILKKLFAKTDPNFLDLRSPCGIVTGQLAYNYNGDIYSCDEGRSDKYYILGNVKKDNYKSIISSKKSKEFVSSSITENYLCDSCVYKPFCGVCPVLSRAETKSLLTTLPKDNHCKIFKFIFDQVFDKVINDYESIKKVFLGFVLKNILESSIEKSRLV